MKISNGRSNKLLSAVIIAIMFTAAAGMFGLGGQTAYAEPSGPQKTVTNGNDTGDGSLRAILGSAEGGDTIVFSGVTTIMLTDVISFSVPDITIDGGAGVTVTKAASGGFGLLECTAASGTLTLRGLTFENGNSSGNGGGVYSQCDIILINCAFEDNTAEFGGGLYAEANVLASNCGFTGNTATGNTAELGGGGIYVTGNASLEGCTFIGNTAELGGGLYADDPAKLTDCTFMNNSASSGGGIESNNIVLDGCTFIGNRANGGSAVNTVNATVTNCGFEGNTSFQGGTVETHLGQLGVSNSTFYANTLVNSGSVTTAILRGADVVVIHSTFARNISNGKSYNVYGSNSLDARNCLMTAGYLTGNGAVSNTDNLLDTNHNYEFFGSNVMTFNYLMPLPGVAGGAVRIAEFGTDAAGNPRGETCQYGASEWSAKSWIVTNSADSGAGSLRQAVIESEADAGTDYKHVIYFDKTNTMTGTSAFSITLTSGEIKFAKDTMIDGRLDPSGDPEITVSGNNASRVFNHDCGTSDTATSYYYGLNVTKGKASGTGSTGAGIRSTGSIFAQFCNVTDNTSGNSGGGVYATYKITLTNCRITGNKTSSSGGGIFSNNVITLTNCVISGNRAAGNGGGVYTFGSVSTINCIVAGNATTNGAKATDANGGGVWSNTSAEFVNSVFSGNSVIDTNFDAAKRDSVGNGGGVWVRTLVTLDGCTVVGNTADHYGGGAYSSEGTMTVSDSLFTENKAAVYGGGGIYAPLTLTVSDSGFIRNTSAIDGGGIYAGAAVTVAGSLFDGNKAMNGGGIYAASDASVSDSSFADNTALNVGGGMTAAGMLVLDSDAFMNNTATTGGGVFAQRSSLVTGSVFANNNADSGGGITVSASSLLVMSNSTVANNNADSGGGIECSYAYIYQSTITGNRGTGITAGSGGSVSLYNCILAGNTDSDGQLSQTDAEAGGDNLIEGSAAVTGVTVTKRNVFGPNVFNQDTGVQRVLGNGIANLAAVPVSAAAVDAADHPNFTDVMKTAVKNSLLEDQLGTARPGPNVTYGAAEGSENNLVSLSVISDDTKKTYFTGDEIELTGTEIHLVYETGEETVPYDIPGMKNNSVNADMETAGEKEIDFEYLDIPSDDPLTVTVAARKTTTVLDVSKSTSVYGESVRLDAVMDHDEGETLTGGTITFFSGTTAIGSFPVNQTHPHTASLTISDLSVGTHSFTALYSGNNTYAGSSSAESVHTVAKADTEIVMGIGPASGAVYGTSVTITAGLGILSPGADELAGKTIIFKQNGTVLGTAVSDADGVAVYSVSALAAGNSTISVEFAGDANLNGSTDSVTYGVAKAGTSITMTADPSGTSVWGDVVTVSAQLNILVGSDNTPAGKTIIFKQNGTEIGTDVCDENGMAELILSNLPTGPFTITAEYADNSNLNGCSAEYSHTVTKVNTGLTLGISPAGGVHAQQPVTVTATLAVSGHEIEGELDGKTITFRQNGTVLGRAVSDDYGVAVLAVDSLPPGDLTITAEFSGDDNMNGSSADAQYTVGKNGSSITVATRMNNSIYGQNVTFTVTVICSDPIRDLLHTGTMEFFDGTEKISERPVSGRGSPWTTEFSVSSLSVGTHSITAVYSGDRDTLGSTSPAITQTVGKAPSTIHITSISSGSTAYGSVVTINASLTADAEAPVNKTIVFKQNGTAIGTGVTNAGGVVTFMTSTLPVGELTITAEFGGDEILNGCVSAGSKYTVSMIPTSVAVSDTAASVYGEKVTFTATVTPGGGNTAPTGTVTFYDGSEVIGTGTVGGTSPYTATVSVSSLTVGAHAIRAEYGGDGIYIGSSGLGDQEVGKAVTMLNITGLSITGTDVLIITARLAVSNPGSAVLTGKNIKFEYSIGGNITSIGETQCAADGTVTISATGLREGVDMTIRAIFEEDDDLLGDFSETTYRIGKFHSEVALTSNDDSPVYGQEVIFTATVTPGNTAPTGNVTFYDGSEVIRTDTVGGTSPYTATVPVSSLTVGRHQITAIYSGDTDHTVASAAMEQTVDKADTTLNIINITPGPGVDYGTSVTITANLGIVAPGADALTGKTIVFRQNGTVLGTAVSDEYGTASCTTTALLAGNTVISAEFEADANLNGSSSDGSQYSVMTLGTDTTIKQSVGTTVHGQTVTFTATVTLGGDDPAPTGTVTFYDDGTAIGTGTIGGTSPYTATVSVSSLTVGSHQITAIYAGDGSHAGSGSVAVTHTVNKADTEVVLEIFPGSRLVTFGGNVTLEAKFKVDSPGSDTLEGKEIIFRYSTDGTDFEELGRALCNSSGLAILSTAALPRGSLSFEAVFEGDENLNGAEAELSDELEVGLTETELTLSMTGGGSLTTGEKATFTAVLTFEPDLDDDSATGFVIFYDGETEIKRYPIEGMSPIRVTFDTSLSLGDHAIRAEYGGNSYYEGSRSQTLAVTVVGEKDQPPFYVVDGDGNVLNVIEKIYGDDPISFNTAGGAGRGDISYSISGPGMIAGNEVVITGAGDIVILVTRNGDNIYNAAHATVIIHVAKKVLAVYVENAEKNQGDENPAFVLRYDGLVNAGDTDAASFIDPVASTDATRDSGKGEYMIILSGGSSANYIFVYHEGTLTVTDDCNIIPWIILAIIVSLIIIVWYRRRKDDEKDGQT